MVYATQGQHSDLFSAACLIGRLLVLAVLVCRLVMCFEWRLAVVVCSVLLLQVSGGESEIGSVKKTALSHIVWLFIVHKTRGPCVSSFEFKTCS